MIAKESASTTEQSVQSGFSGKVALLSNYIAPYRLPAFQLLSSRIQTLKFFASVGMPADRSWPIKFANLDVTVQRSIVFTRKERNADNFTEDNTIFLPYDTWPLLLRYRPDVIIATDFGVRAMQACIYCMLTGAKYVAWSLISESTERSRGNVRLALRRFLLRHAGAVLINGESSRRYLQRFGYPDKKMFAAPCTTDPEMFREIAPRPLRQIRHLLVVGQLIERKGLEPFLQQLGHWAQNNSSREIDLILLGRGPLRSALEQITLPPNLHMRIVSEVPYGQVVDYYRATDLLAFPTLADEWGLVVNEAMSAGLPVLGSMHGQAVEELVIDGVNGWTYRPEDEASAEDAIDRALNASPEQIEAMRQSARDTIASLTPQFMADQMLAAIECARRAS